MAAAADCIDDLDVIRSGGMLGLVGEVYACATLGQFLAGDLMNLTSDKRDPRISPSPTTSWADSAQPLFGDHPIVPREVR